MDSLPVNYYRRGDKVMARIGYSHSGPWIPGRVIRCHEWGDLKIATSLTDSQVVGFRYLPAGTPVYECVGPESVRLISHDPHWDPYGVIPFTTPPESALLGGVPGWPTPIPGLWHVGAYIAGVDYDKGDPAWVWEKDSGWHRAVAINGQRSWVSTRFVDGYRLPNGRTSKSYRPAKVWPVICDYPEPVREITVDDTWAKIGDLQRARLIAQQLGNRTRLGRHPGLS